MTRYEFEDTATGEMVEIAMPMRDAVPIGETIERDGRTLRRVVSSGLRTRDGFVPFTNHSMPLNHPIAPRHDANGRAVFNTRAEVMETIARDKASKTPLGLEWKK